MFKKGYFSLGLFLIFSCSPSKINQYIKVEGEVQRRDGKWIEEYSSNEGNLISKGSYKNGEKVGVWKTTLNGNAYQKDRYRKSITRTKVYYPSGKIREKGQSKTEIKDDFRHWYYNGDWKYYDENGKLWYIKRYYGNNKFDSIDVGK